MAELTSDVLSQVPALLESLDLTPEEKKALKAEAKKSLMGLLQKTNEANQRVLKGAQIAADQARMKEKQRLERQGRCSHTVKTIKGETTNLAGQWMGSHCVLICQGCRKTFSVPPQPDKGYSMPPGELLPPENMVGGDKTPYAEVAFKEAYDRKNRKKPEAA